MSDRSSSPSDNRSLPPTSPQQTNSSQVTSPNAVDPYARVDVAKKAYERQKKAELERRWRLNSGTHAENINQRFVISCYIADEPQKDELNTCVKKITKNIYALLEAQKSTTDK